MCLSSSITAHLQTTHYSEKANIILNFSQALSKLETFFTPARDGNHRHSALRNWKQIQWQKKRTVVNGARRKRAVYPFQIWGLLLSVAAPMLHMHECISENISQTWTKRNNFKRCHRQLLTAGKPPPGSLMLVSHKTVFQTAIMLHWWEIPGWYCSETHGPIGHLTWNFYTKYSWGLGSGEARSVLSHRVEASKELAWLPKMRCLERLQV